MAYGTGIFSGEGADNPLSSLAAARPSGLLNRRNLVALLSGIAQPNQGGDFFGGLQAGLRGSLAGGMQYDSLQEQRMAKQRAADNEAAMAFLRFAPKEPRAATPARPLQPTSDQALLGMSDSEFARLLDRRGKISMAGKSPSPPRHTSNRSVSPKPPKQSPVKPGQAYSLSGEKLDAEMVQLMGQLRVAGPDRSAQLHGVADNANLPGAVRAAAMQRLREIETVGPSK